MSEANKGATSWVDAFPPEDKTYFTAKGWDKLPDVPTAFGAVLKSYREAEGALKIPAAERFQLGETPTEEQLKALHARLGVPETPDKYDFADVKVGDAALPEERVAQLRALAHSNKLTPAQAKGVASALAQAEADAATAARAARTVSDQAEDIKLRAGWGGNYDVNKAVLTRFADQAGFTPAQRDAFMSTAAGQMMLYAVASADKEGGMPRVPGGGGGNGPMTREQAAQELERKKEDPAWVDAYMNRGYSPDKPHPQHAAALKEFTDLTQLMSGMPNRYENLAR